MQFGRKADKKQLDKLKKEVSFKDSQFIPEVVDSGLLTESAVPLTAYYDDKRLVEIAIIGSEQKVSRKVIGAISLAVPYHSSLTRFTFRKSGLTAKLIYDIKKLLPISNISEIIFDDSYVKEANYYILLEQFSQLKYLSLNRCKINDEACRKIFENITFEAPASNSLQLLELGSNYITDKGAIFIGSVLRTNRSLVHLNLSGNKITDCGFISILDSLMEFPLDSKEKYAMRQRKLRYLRNKVTIYERCLKSLKSRNFDDVDSVPSGSKRLSMKQTRLSMKQSLSMKRLRLKSKKSTIKTFEEQAEIMTRAILGEFNDPFSRDDVVLKDDAIFSKGNYVLCYVNVAYNNLEYRSLRKLLEVLQYQDEMRMKRKFFKGTGLIRVTLDGNYVPKTCSVLHEINNYFKKVINFRTFSGSCKKSNSR